MNKLPPDQRLPQIAVTSVATLLLGVAGVVGTKQPEITLWAVFLAGVCYTFAIHKDLRFRKVHTAGIVVGLCVASIGVQIWLITQHKKQPQVITIPSKVEGAATTNAPRSVANTGTIGSVNITGDGDDVGPTKKTTPKRK
ncbi:hypothetical protein [Tunturiibacter gelidoferens]|uniref:Uncharacterized protein n=1 Tax=Tunturiibacter gelidiferens TaxID=3069689 RepID=A0A9X0U4F7_9BACT|nr:hypothetical protein [Edaphobacter lichenicola]MBB5329421.1 hypothetical protein [Edaphobacter lichenicola]